MKSSERSADASPSVSGLRIELGSAAVMARSNSTAWAQLAAERAETAPFMDPAWIGTFNSVCAQNGLMVATAWDGDRIMGLAPFFRTQTSRWPVPVRSAQSPTFDWLNRCEFLAKGSRADIVDALWRVLLSTDVCDVVHLELVPESSPTLKRSLSVAADRGWKATVNPTCYSPWRALPSHEEGWDRGLKTKFKANLRNREQRLAQLGHVRFEVVRDSEKLPIAMETFYRLEASGWKGKKQTSIMQRPDVRRFYDAFVQSAPGEIWIPILYVHEIPIAAQFIRTCGATVYLLKIGFDPEFSPYSPGQLITARTMAYCIEQGYTAFDFLGEQMTWKMDWNPQLRAYCQAKFFAPNAAGRYAYWSQVGYRRVLKRVPGLQSLVRRTRRQRARE